MATPQTKRFRPKPPETMRDPARKVAMHCSLDLQKKLTERGLHELTVKQFAVVHSVLTAYLTQFCESIISDAIKREDVRIAALQFSTPEPVTLEPKEA